MSYFRFFPDCQFVTGPARGAIYDISRIRVVQLSETDTGIIKLWLHNEEINVVEKKFGHAAKELLSQFLREGFGQIFDSPVVAEPYYPKCKWEMQGFLEQPPNLRTAYIQLSDRCDAKCDFCANSSYYNWQGCNSCMKWLKGGKRNRLNGLDLDSAFEQLMNMEVQMLIFSGGNPVLEWPEVTRITNMLKNRNSGLTVKVHTSGSGITELIVKEAKSLNIVFCFTVFGESYESYKKVTGDASLLDSLNRAIELCNQNNVQYAICLMITPNSREEYKSMYKFAMKLGGIHIFTTELIPRFGEKYSIVSLPTGQERIEQVGPSDYFARQDLNTCLNGTIAIASNGVILPCPSWENEIGNIFTEDDLFSVFRRGLITASWRYTKDNVYVCKNCEYRYSCSDCSVLEWALNKDTSVHSVYCRYRPELGVWLGEAENLINLSRIG